MRKGERIAGFNALEHMSSKNYHVTDINGRAYLCDCCKSIWQRQPKEKGRRLAHMMVLRGSKQHRLSTGSRLYIFYRNLEQIVSSRNRLDELKTRLLTKHFGSDVNHWDDWKRKAVGTMLLEQENVKWLKEHTDDTSY